MTDFSASEQDIIDDCIRCRTDTFVKPPYMASPKATQIKLHLRRVLATLPAEPQTTSRAHRVHYNAQRRVRWFGFKRGKIHEAGLDGLPVCHWGNPGGWFDRANGAGVEHLGPGPVTCGHCANASGR